MTINFCPLTEKDANYSKVIELYGSAFPKVQRVPPWVLRYRLKKGKAGFEVLYEHEKWIGFIFTKDYKDIVSVQFFAISESCRSSGYGSKVMESMKERHSGKRIVLNIEELDAEAENCQQRIKRKAFYEKNGFSSSGYLVKELAERQEVLIHGGSINKEEIEAMHKYFLGYILGFLLKLEVTKI